MVCATEPRVGGGRARIRYDCWLSVLNSEVKVVFVYKACCLTYGPSRYCPSTLGFERARVAPLVAFAFCCSAQLHLFAAVPPAHSSGRRNAPSSASLGVTMFRHPTGSSLKSLHNPRKSEFGDPHVNTPYFLGRSLPPSSIVPGRALQSLREIGTSEHHLGR